jgi:hypothetical protein
MSVRRAYFAVLALAGVVVAAACFSEHSTPTAPTTPTTPTTNVGDIFFTSALNGSSNPAVDTVAVNGTVTGPGPPGMSCRTAFNPWARRVSPAAAS